MADKEIKKPRLEVNAGSIGTWSCSRCLTSNPLHHTDCGQCRRPKVIVQGWACKHCEAINDNLKLNCKKCSWMRRTNTNSQFEVDDDPNEITLWTCQTCFSINHPDTWICLCCKNPKVKKEQEYWTCIQCCLKSHNSLSQCEMCGVPSPGRLLEHYKTNPTLILPPIGNSQVIGLNGKRYNKTEILPESVEYAHIRDNFLTETVNNFLSKRSVRIFKVHNKSLQKLYDVQRDLMYEIRGRDEAIESLLWHGTHYSVIESILNNGFDRNYAGTRHGALHGKGNYFCNEFTIAKSYCTAAPDGYITMLLCQVLTGKYCAGSQDLLEPPPMAKNPLDRYDSVVNNVVKPTIFVSFRDGLTYPMYQISHLAAEQ